MPVAIPVANIARHFNPLKKDPWGTGLTLADVKAAIRDKRFVADHTSEDHAARIAYLVNNPANDPLDIDVGVPALGHTVSWPILDGNHRLAAAILRKDKTILAEVGGQMDYARHLFGVDCDEDPLSESD